jgi:DNA-binding response OmpR family regulator
MAAEIQAAKPRIDLSRYQLTVDGRRVKLERQPMELLIFFVQRKDQLVIREDIVDKLWGQHVFVDVDRSINSAVRKIRTALETIPPIQGIWRQLLARATVLQAMSNWSIPLSQHHSRELTTARPGPL